MKKLKVLMLSLLLVAPMVINAAGMGLYVPVSFANSSSVTKNYDTDLIPDQEVDIDYKPSAGFGITFDSNIGKDALFNYRLGLELMQQTMDTVNGDPCTGECENARFNMVHTFGFGVLRTQRVRLWVGPRINIAYEWDTGDYGYSRGGVEFGVAPAVGVNVNLGRVVSLAADIDYKIATTVGWWDSNIPFDGGSYSGSTTGPTARFYVLFRFGEPFQRPTPQSVNQGVIDQNL